MFDKKDVDQYKKITAPDTLKTRIVSTYQAKQESRHSNAKQTRDSRLRLKPLVLTMAAASVLLILGIYLFSHQEAPFHLIMNGTTIEGEVKVEIMAAKRMTLVDDDLEILLLNFSLYTTSPSQISVQDGNLYLDSGSSAESKMDIEGRKDLSWALDASTDNVYELVVESKGSSKTYELRFDVESKLWVFMEQDN